MSKIFLSILSDNSGGLSSIRIVMAIWFTTLTAVWIWSALKARTVPDIPPGVLTLTGIIIGGKVVQRFGEKEEKK